MTGTGSCQADHKSILVNYWMEKAHESLVAGRSEYKSGRLTTAVRNLYYACFYALTALLLKEGRSFKKHTGVKAALHKDLIREGILEAGDFRAIITKDPAQTLLRWMGDPVKIKLELEKSGSEWTSFCAVCRDAYGFNPEKDGAIGIRIKS